MPNLSWRAKIALLFIGPALFFSGAEIATRLSYKDLSLPYPGLERLRDGSSIYQRDPILFWKFKPGGSSWINQSGYIGKEVESTKHEECIRIMAFGDSCTRGSSVAHPEDAYPALLETMLDSTNHEKRYEVMNMGVDGYSSYQMLKLMEQTVQLYQPDLVVINLDTHGASEAFAGIPDEEQAIPFSCASRIQALLDRSKFYLFLKKNVIAFMAWRAALRYGRRPSRVPIPSLKRNMARMKKICDSVGAHVIFMNAQRYQIEKSYPRLVSYNREVELFCRENRLPFVDLQDLFSNHAREEELYSSLPDDTCHPSRRGYLVIAGELYYYVRKLLLANQ